MSTNKKKKGDNNCQSKDSNIKRRLGPEEYEDLKFNVGEDDE